LKEKGNLGERSAKAGWGKTKVEENAKKKLNGQTGNYGG